MISKETKELYDLFSLEVVEMCLTEFKEDIFFNNESNNIDKWTVKQNELEFYLDIRKGKGVLGNE